jgi:hypothetical protein
MARGGRNEPANRALACAWCNLKKRTAVQAVDPSTGTFVTLFNPRLDAWTMHFEAHTLTGYIRGLTAVGRATVDLLQLNADELLEAREAWATSGWWP